MEADEDGTIARRKAYRAELFDPKISEPDGRIATTIGELGLPTVLIQEGG